MGNEIVNKVANSGLITIDMGEASIRHALARLSEGLLSESAKRIEIRQGRVYSA